MPVTLLDLAVTLAKALDDCGSYPISAVGASTVTSTKLIDATPNASVQRHNGAWAYASSQQRVVQTAGLVPSTGLISIRPPWSPNPTIGTSLYLTHLFPMSAEVPAEDRSYKGIAASALWLLARPGTTDLVIAKDATSYDLPSWIDSPERTVAGPDGAPRILEPHPLGRSAIGSAWRGWHLTVEGETPRLNLDAPFSSDSGVLTMEVVRPIPTWVATAGVWGESTTGPVNDSDQVMLASAEEALPAMLYVAFRALSVRPPGQPFPNAAAMMGSWLDEARKSSLWDRLRDRAAPAAPAGAAA